MRHPSKNQPTHPVQVSQRVAAGTFGKHQKISVTKAALILCHTSSSFRQPFGALELTLTLRT